MKSICEPGAVFGRWTVIEKAEDRKAVCICECGNTKKVYRSNLTTGKSLSCGCLTKEVNSERMSTHGESNTKLYGVWLAMRRRCYLVTDGSYKNYGIRGIEVCEEWKTSFEPFRDWSLSHGYEEGLTIERMENDKNYTPENCSWVDRLTQGNNKRNNLNLTINGETHTSSQWSRSSKISRGTIESRIKRGWSGAKLLVPSHLGNNQFTNF
jgi:hypothetical protein